jgi:hypothetical protein
MAGRSSPNESLGATGTLRGTCDSGDDDCFGGSVGVAILTQRELPVYTLPIGMQRTMTGTDVSDSTSQVTMRYRKVLQTVTESV